MKRGSCGVGRVANLREIYRKCHRYTDGYLDGAASTSKFRCVRRPLLAPHFIEPALPPSLFLYQMGRAFELYSALGVVVQIVYSGIAIWQTIDQMRSQSEIFLWYFIWPLGAAQFSAVFYLLAALATIRTTAVHIERLSL